MKTEKLSDVYKGGYKVSPTTPGQEEIAAVRTKGPQLVHFWSPPRGAAPHLRHSVPFHSYQCTAPQRGQFGAATAPQLQGPSVLVAPGHTGRPAPPPGAALCRAADPSPSFLEASPGRASGLHMGSVRGFIQQPLGGTSHLERSDLRRGQPDLSSASLGSKVSLAPLTKGLSAA